MVLLRTLMDQGLALVVVCPGSRSGPLAVAAGLLEPQGLALRTALDERSAAFFGLGWSRAQGRPAAVITTSGTAVANLLPAVVEADYGAIPLLLLTADRPVGLKGCGANQTVNQEMFLAANVRWLGCSPPEGLAAAEPDQIRELAQRAMAYSLGIAGQQTPSLAAPGPVHLNLAFAEPLHASGGVLLAEAFGVLTAPGLASAAGPAATTGPLPAQGISSPIPPGLAGLDPDRPGVVVAGPWRGMPGQWQGFEVGLRRWHKRTGWPLLADFLSGLRGLPGLGQINGYDLLLEAAGAPLETCQVLRLGPLPASRRLQRWLEQIQGHQVLVSQGDPRNLNPLGGDCVQTSMGLEAWLDQLPEALWSQPASETCTAQAALWQQREQRLQLQLGQALSGSGLNEPALARQLSQLLPAGVPLVLANSSPVRDWESFSDPAAPARQVFAFRGASGIDGTLSLACGVADALGSAVLVTGDLALLHDSHGWLWRQQLAGRLTVVLLNNNGGGIFEQLPIRPEPGQAMDFERLFAMPQQVVPLALAAAYGVPGRRCRQAINLPADLEWALGQPLALLELGTDRRSDALLRQQLRKMCQTT
ncbi:2-succinyl-5-enolpyruvyl-6-hydroxy-3-cyclohexene-1-carboxylic-acid synthase [Cyanobium sp. WAJ14-Wanaka]|uniref:2-succinyl-5-enolpyruvyl-6-hydroxy-3- cyclohexene-1-carboxylic-acid synthase n=1 Tax=Cyanobium sp. WAJ14-Wanaka TaxID=2823725 RepID=UPI0028F3EC05|nr:2-succinyl-5-enolpyruvyl-6-hydroxy-3-cyclohexene-1-carboxylic-acid synthase [Cyanobium sp. WAJ14-Wanaka]